MRTTREKPDLEGLKIVEAYAEWDDPDAFRVFLRYESKDGLREETVPLEAEYMPNGTVEQRLYYAAVYANPGDFVGRPADREIGWEKEPPAKRAAKACNAELKRIAKGEAPPDPQAVSLGLQLAAVMKGKRR